MNQAATVSIEELIAYETLISQNLLRARGKISERQEAALRDVVPPVYATPKAAGMFPDYFFSSPISSDVYSLIAEGFKHFPDLAVTESDISAARKYTSDLLGVDLQSVRVEVVPTPEWDHGHGAEGFQIPIGLKDHMVFVPAAFTSPVELLCHEFGHAGHTTAQRQNGELPYFFVMPTTAELVAHFCQYNYLLDHGTRAQFVSALGQLTTATFAHSIVSSNELDDFEAFLKTEYAEAISRAMPFEVIERTYRAFSADKPHLYRESLRGIAIILALWLVDDHEGMKRFISADRIDQTLVVKLDAAFPGVDFMDAFSNVNEQIYKLLDRFNR
jgi:hypothetical protein